MPNRPLLLTDSDVFAGTERHILDLARGLGAQDVAASVGCPADTPLARAARDHGIEHRPIEKRGAIDRAAVRQLTAYLRDHQIDLIHAHNGRSALHAAMAVRCAGRGKLVMTQHFIQPGRAGRRRVQRFVAQRMHRWMSRRLDHTIAISNAVRDAAIERGDCPPGRISVVHNGIADPADPAAATLGAAGDVRRGLQVPPDAPLVVCAARLQPEKDLPTLIDAMKRTLGKVPDARCVIAGQGVERHDLEAHIQAAGLRNAVRLLGFREDVRRIIAAGDVLALPAKAEPFGLVLLEAMALGRPVLATRAGGPLDIVHDGETGLLVEPSNPAAMAEALVRLLNDKPLRARYGRAGRQRFEARFTADRMAARTAAVYDQAPVAADPASAASPTPEPANPCASC
ncbi:MAG: glycosyltransferase [Alphaproteobacteria bacterium]|jgi:glycosyltransferase involved in cell wall biosynthesis|nr:glycosyltransferase [Alphaproteobacteria bacterium]